MDVKWVIEKNIFDDGDDLLIASLKKREIEYKEIPYIPFEQDEYIKKAFPADSCVVSHGSINFIKKLQRETEWIPGYFANFNNFKCSNYYKYFFKYLLNKNHFFVPFGIIDHLKEKVFDGKDRVFIRPDSGEKFFTGKVVSYDNVDEELKVERVCYDVPKEAMILVANVVDSIEAEYRFIVADDEVLTGSQYRINGKYLPSGVFDSEAKNYLQSVLNDVKYRPDRVFTADIAKVDGKFSLIELNSFSSCGLYCCDSEKIVDRINKIAEEEYNSYII